MKLGLSVTLAGTAAMLGSLLDNCATGLLLNAADIGGIDTKPESTAPPTALGVLRVSDNRDGADGCTVSRVLCVDVPALAVISEQPAAPLIARTVKFAVPPAMPFEVVTEAGTPATDGMLLVRDTIATQLLHNPLTVTVPVELLPALTRAGDSFTEATTAALIPSTAATGAATASRRSVARIDRFASSRVPPALLNMIRPPHD